MLRGAVIAACDEVTVGIEDFDDGVEGDFGRIDIDPNFRSSGCNKAEEVLVGGFAENTLNNKSEAKVFIARLGVGRQGSHELSGKHRIVESRCDDVRLFEFQHGLNIAIVAE